MKNEYFDNEFLTGIAANKLIVCITDPRVPFKPMLTVRDTNITNQSLPRILFSSLFSQVDDLIDLDIRLKIRIGLSTSRPRLTRITQNGENIENAKPDSLFRDLNEHILTSLGGSGYLILIITNLHRISNDKVAFLMSMMKHAQINFGIIIISNTQFLKKIMFDKPKVYLEFYMGIDGFISSKADIQFINSCSTFIDGINELKKNYKPNSE
jgi:hypothetical protein